MNEAHVHLIVNHLPIVGVLIGFLVLITGYSIKNPQIKNTSLGIFIFSAVASVAAFYSGEGAADVVEHISGKSETLMHAHEEYAELFFTLTLILGGVSVLTAFFEYMKFPFATYGFLAVLLLSITTMVISYYVGTSGGEITHVEIRKDADVIKIETKKHDGSDDYDDDDDD
jgi:uncharacterized membrane protein